MSCFLSQSRIAAPHALRATLLHKRTWLPHWNLLPHNMDLPAAAAAAAAAQNLMHASFQAHSTQQRMASARQPTLTMRPKASTLAPMVPSAAERVRGVGWEGEGV